MSALTSSSLARISCRHCSDTEKLACLLARAMRERAKGVGFLFAAGFVAATKETSLLALLYVHGAVDEREGDEMVWRVVFLGAWPFLITWSSRLWTL